MRDEYKDILKRSGKKITAQRMAILDILLVRPEEHLTAEEIYDYVKLTNQETGLATVYRTLQTLLELKLIDKLNLDDGCVRYEIVKGREEAKGHHHHHLICLDCGKVLAFQDDLLENLEQRIEADMGFKIVDHEVKLYGYCEDCLRDSGR